MSNAVTEVSDTVRESLSEVVADAQALLDSMRKEGAEKYGDAFHRLQRNVERARDRLDSNADAQMRRVRHAARMADATVHEHPWAAAGTAMMVGAAAGALAAFFLTRR